MIKRLEKKFLSVFMALALVIGLLPTLTLPASATGVPVTFVDGATEEDNFIRNNSFTRTISGATFTFSTGSNDSQHTYSANYSDFETDTGGLTGAYAGSTRNGTTGVDFTVSVQSGYTFDLTGFDFSATTGQIQVYYNGMSTHEDYTAGVNTTTTESNLTAFNDVTAVTFSSENFAIFQNLYIDDVKNGPPTISSASRDRLQLA